MRRSDLMEEYQEWLFDFIRFDDYCDRYGRLLDLLSSREFTWFVEHDENRAEDGFALRWKFASEYGCDEDFWVGRMPEHCSLLEMMIAVSLRIEDVVYDPDEGRRSAVWFWKMIWNLGLKDMTNVGYDQQKIDICLDTWLNRHYAFDGKGGLFTVKNSKIDMRRDEIWYQMHAWIMENFQF